MGLGGPPRGAREGVKAQWPFQTLEGGPSPVAVPVFGSVHPLPGAFDVREADPGVEGLCVLCDELLERQWGAASRLHLPSPRQAS